MSANLLAWQGLEYAGVLVTGALAAFWGAPLVVLGAAAPLAPDPCYDGAHTGRCGA